MDDVIITGAAVDLIRKLEKISAAIGDKPDEINKFSLEDRKLVYEARMKLVELYSGNVKGFPGNLEKCFDWLQAAGRLNGPDLPAKEAYLGVSQILNLLCTASGEPDKGALADNARMACDADIVEQLKSADIAFFTGATCAYYAQYVLENGPKETAQSIAGSFRESAAAYFAMGCKMDGTEAAALCAKELVKLQDLGYGIERTRGTKGSKPPSARPT